MNRQLSSGTPSDRKELRSDEAVLDAAFDVLALTDTPRAICARAGACLQQSLYSIDYYCLDYGNTDTDKAKIKSYVTYATYGTTVRELCREVAALWRNSAESPLLTAPLGDCSEYEARRNGYEATLYKETLPLVVVHYQKVREDLLNKLESTGLEQEVAKSMINAIENQYLKSYGFDSKSRTQLQTVIDTQAREIPAPEPTQQKR